MSKRTSREKLELIAKSAIFPAAMGAMLKGALGNITTDEEADGVWDMVKDAAANDPSFRAVLEAIVTGRPVPQDQEG